MFVTAIETVEKFTRPIHSISRNYGASRAIPGAATLFFVNAEGWAFTCKHVAAVIIDSDRARAHYEAFKDERAKLASGPDALAQLSSLEQTFGYAPNVTVEIMNNFVNCVEGALDLDIRLHPTLDVALIKFGNFSRLLCDSFPVFAANGSMLKQGRSICRLGFPFPEFRNFEYDASTDALRWNADPRNVTPRFPIDGMVTRLLHDASGTTAGFELSTPGLRGQSGGPAFDVEGRIWGMQSATAHLDLDFDVDVEVLRSGIEKRVRDSAFLHVGHCVHVDMLKDFMRANGADFQEG